MLKVVHSIRAKRVIKLIPFRRTKVNTGDENGVAFDIISTIRSTCKVGEVVATPGTNFSTDREDLMPITIYVVDVHLTRPTQHAPYTGLLKTRRKHTDVTTSRRDYLTVNKARL